MAGRCRIDPLGAGRWDTTDRPRDGLGDGTTTNDPSQASVLVRRVS